MTFSNFIAFIIGLMIIGFVAISLAYGVNKELDRQANLSYDSSTGRMVYIEPGV